VYKNLNELAESLYLKEQNNKAELIYKYLCKTNFNISNLIGYCKTLIASENNKKIIKAIKLLNDIVDNIKLANSDLLIVKRTLGNAYCNIKEYEIARVFYENCLKIDYNDATSHCNIAVTYYLEEEYLKAIDNYKKALSINNSSVEALSGLSLLYVKLEDYNSSLSYLEKAIKISPSSNLIINQLCKLYFEYKTKFNLKLYIENYLNYDSLNVDILYLYSVILYKENNFKQCELELIKILTIEPKYTFASELFIFVKKRNNLLAEGLL